MSDTAFDPTSPSAGPTARTARRVGRVLTALALAGCAAAPDPGFSLDPPAPALIRADADAVVDPREIVALVDTAEAAADLRTGAAAEGFVPRSEIALDGLGQRLLAFTIPAPLDGPGAIAALERIEPSATAGVNHAYASAATPASAERFDYANALIGWPRPCPASGPVGMLDTGIDTAALAASGAEIVARRFVEGGATRHGTDVASVLVDPRRLDGARLYAAAVVGPTAAGGEAAGVDTLLEALDWLAAEGVRVVNVSLAGPYNKLLDRGVDRAAALGLTIVAAVGNDGVGAPPRYPAALDNVIAVTAVDARPAIYREAVRGAHVDLAAPGVDVRVPVPGPMRFATGTSIAVPFVAARIAADPDLYHAGVVRIREALGASTVDLGPTGTDSVYGAGLVRAASGC